MYRGYVYDPYIDEINRPYVDWIGILFLILLIIAFAIVDPLLIRFIYFSTFAVTQIPIDFLFWLALSGFSVIISICVCLIYALWILRNLYNDYQY